MSSPDVQTFFRLEPPTQHNIALLNNVHPSNWRNPTPRARYNLVVIGAGTAGLVTAAGAVGLGAKVALVERALMGGECLNTGCVPSKALIRASGAAAEMSFMSGWNSEGGKQVDKPIQFAAAMERMRALRAKISENDSVARFTALGVDVFIGNARFVSQGVVEVESSSGNARLNYSRAVIATGARAAVPPIAGLAEAGYHTNETIFNLTELPPRLAIIGGGPIGCELAQAFARLGSQVTVLEMGAQFLPREDPDAASVLLRALRRDGVNIRLNASVQRVSMASSEKQIHFSVDGRANVLPADIILVGVGRAPNVEGLNLEAVGVQYDSKSGVQVDDTLQTTNARIFAAGDVCLPHKFTHTADASARIVIQNALFSIGPFGKRRWSDEIIPWCTYTDPEIAHVGMSEAEANARKIAVDTYRVEMRDVDRAVLDASAVPEGFLTIHTRRGTDKILGATMVSTYAGETISEITLAMRQRVGLGQLSGVIHPYPTQAEAIRKCADAYRGTRLTPGLKSVLQRWLRWRL
jgi:pyruvate/2-oxoglutarate dehydrogenase complex dihydrolipoamide dehydrogenase (E3) component